MMGELKNDPICFAIICFMVNFHCFMVVCCAGGARGLHAIGGEKKIQSG